MYPNILICQNKFYQRPTTDAGYNLTCEWITKPIIIIIITKENIKMLLLRKRYIGTIQDYVLNQYNKQCLSWSE